MGYRRKIQVTLLDWIKSYLQAREDEEGGSGERGRSRRRIPQFMWQYCIIMDLERLK